MTPDVRRLRVARVCVAIAIAAMFGSALLVIVSIINDVNPSPALRSMGICAGATVAGLTYLRGRQRR